MSGMKQEMRAVLCGMLAVGLMAASASADMALSVDTSTLEFQYTSGSGAPGSVGHMDVVMTINSVTSVQQLDLGADGSLGGGDDSVLDMAKATGTFAPSYETVLSADVYQAGANDYSIIGTYVLGDTADQVAIEGAFTSSFVALSNSALFIGGVVTNSDGVLRPGSPNTSWIYAGNAGDTPDMINGNPGGEDGVDGTVTVADQRDLWRLANLFEFQLVGDFFDLDGLFASESVTSSVANANLTVQQVPEPAATTLGFIGLGLIAWLRRR